MAKIRMLSILHTNLFKSRCRNTNTMWHHYVFPTGKNVNFTHNIGHTKKIAPCDTSSQRDDLLFKQLIQF